MDVRLVYTLGPLVMGDIDALLEGADLAKGRDLETAVIISLFTNKRAELDDRLPNLCCFVTSMEDSYD